MAALQMTELAAELPFHDIAIELFKAALTAAREGLLFREEGALDAEDEGAGNWLEHDKDRYLHAIAATLPEEPRAADVGDLPILADKEAHKAVADLLETGHLVSEQFCLVGEEAPPSAWGRMQRAAPGTLILVLDAIDGSGPYENLTFGYGTTLLALRRRERQPGDPNSAMPFMDELQGAAVCNSSGYMVSMKAVGGVGSDIVAGFLWDDTAPFIELSEPDYPASSTNSVAVVGAKPLGRRNASSLLEVPDGDEVIVYNTGGAPAALGLLLGRLGAMVSFERQTMWDTAYLPIFASLGVQLFMVPSGRSFGIREVTTWFSYLTHQREGVRPVPPFLATRRAEDAGELLRRINPSP